MQAIRSNLVGAFGATVVGIILCQGRLAAQSPQPQPAATPPAASIPFQTVHPWTNFGVGSWKEVLVHHQSLSEDGKVVSSSVTQTRTTLIENSDAGYALRIEVEVEVAGRRLPVEPKVIRQGLHGESAGQTVQVQPVGPGEVVVDSQKLPVEIRRVTINGDDLKRVSLIHYSDQVSPYILRRETKATDVSGMKPSYESTVEVLAVEMPYRFLDETKLVTQVKTTRRQANGSSSVTMEFYADEVPGGVVANSVKEVDSSGRVIARSTLELTQYQAVRSSPVSNTVPTSRRRGVFHRGRNR